MPGRDTSRATELWLLRTSSTTPGLDRAQGADDYSICLRYIPQSVTSVKEGGTPEVPQTFYRRDPQVELALIRKICPTNHNRPPPGITEDRRRPPLERLETRLAVAEHRWRVYAIHLERVER